ncbi:MAG: Peptide transporter permease [Microbacteriaceae bacterium]|jgi:peptide/nickel transport system permease protein|nr:Peptide transporter permease [Microbacteriaceae bacterium]
MSELEVQAGLGRRSLPGVSVRRRPGVVEILAIVVALFLVVSAVLPGLVAPADPLGINPLSAFQGPSIAHWFGTDESGRDIFTRVIHGTGSSLLIGVAATAIGLGLGIALGTLAGMLGPVVDFGVNRLLEVLFAFPGLLLALVFILIFGPGTATATVAVGLSTAPGYARIIRGQLITVRGSAFVEAATVLGRTRWQVLTGHILPNTLAPLFVLGTLGIGQAIVWAAALSYLGLGAQPPAAEWGAMLSAGRTYITTGWWMSFFPGVFIVLTAVTATALGRSIERRMNHA